ncbi:uncharacterized protein AKAME5_001306700 [Lates japonicus]|uniref:Uncharacterized protein n=1 Tax=Lates japonicus TaxID=270547 RepID=A0AAD3MVJ4_LATJO|nr:uncharacterized protein AKAME5_001306700 [Lates japonicus]
MLALSASLQETGLDIMSRELGHLMSTLVQTRYQVWLAKLHLTQTCRRTLCSVPVKPEELFSPAALKAGSHVSTESSSFREA